jgi:site-specific DNA-methyltransferase (adenine-specific)
LASVFDQIQKDGLVFDETDVIRALIRFQNTYCSTEARLQIRSVKELVERIDADCLGNTRKRLCVKLHQAITRLKFEKLINQTRTFEWCIAHIMRSGKSITILLLCKYLLEIQGTKRILVMTSVPATLESFISDLNTYIDFKNINFKTQDEFAEVDESFSGIVFCSTQFLKKDGQTTEKKKILKKYKFDAIFMDECQLGGATEKTQNNIMNVDIEPQSSMDNDVLDIVDEIKQGIRIRVLVSGTADSTCRALGIHQKSVWDLEDQNAMKRIMSNDVSQVEKNEYMEFMTYRHGVEFLDCFNDQTLNRDYSKCPTQVLIRHTVSPKFAKMIEEHNRENNTKLGYDCVELFSLSQESVAPDNETPDNCKVQYIEKFAICKTNNGIKVLKGFLNTIISNDMNDTTSIMHHIETTQSQYGSRISTEENPLLFLVYLPVNTGNGNIYMLQNTLKKFIHDNGLWSNYHVASSSSQDTHGGATYNNFVKGLMLETKRLGKTGCVLLLGNQGTVGITYKECDATIHLDNGMNLDAMKQRMARALTDADGKTIGINVDMNIQRTYTFVLDKIHQYRHATNTTKTYPEILQYMFKRNIFLFNPHEINFGNVRSDEIHAYYKRQIDEVMKSGVVDDSVLLDQILCEDSFRNIIRGYQHSRVIQQQVINPILNGLHPDVPTAEPDKVLQNSYTLPPSAEPTTPSPEQISPEKMEEIINITFEICRTFLFPLLAMISRVFDSEIQTFANIFTNPKTKSLLINLLKDKKIDLNEETYSVFIDAVNTIIDANMEIVNNIREIYRTTDPLRYRELIAKHFIPTETERKGNAEVPTPVPLVNDMLHKMPAEFWTTPKKVFEPCCGKGNFVLGIFDKFWKGLAETIPDEIERCRIIMTECIYYADLTPLNVFITTEIMKCHVQSYCGLKVLDYEFNRYVGDTLKLDIEQQWRIPIEQFAAIGNPPYSTDPSKPDTKPLYDKFILKYINCSFLLFVVPSRWFIGGKGLDYFREFMLKRTDIVFIQHTDDATAWFGKSVSIEGGVNYFLKDSHHTGECVFNGLSYNLSKYDCIIKPKYHALVDIVSTMNSVSTLYKGRFFGIETNETACFSDTGRIKCFVSLQKSKDRCKYIDNYEFTESNTFWKVITTEANGKSPKFGEKFIGKPDEIHTGSYISFRVNNEDEAKSLLSYFETKFANHMLSIRKISQHINANVCKWIPLLPLDRAWTDESVCEYLNIDKSLYM